MLPVSVQKNRITGATQGGSPVLSLSPLAPAPVVLLIGVVFLRNWLRLWSFVGVPRDGTGRDGELAVLSSAPNLVTCVRARPELRRPPLAEVAKMLSR